MLVLLLPNTNHANIYTVLSKHVTHLNDHILLINKEIFVRNI